MKLPPNRILLGLAALGLAVPLACAGLVGPCWSAWLLRGIRVDRCPAGELRPVAWLTADSVGRGDWGRVRVGLAVHYLDPRHGPRVTDGRRFSTTLTAIDPDGKATVLEPKKGWSGAGSVWLNEDDAPRGSWDEGMVQLPDGPDGEWTLRAVLTSPAGESTAEVPLSLYAPALTHVLPDAPLYRPGQTMQFRAVLLHEADLTPLAGRPGRWQVYDPDGNLVLDEKGKSSAMGVVASSFPLDPAAGSGQWRIRFESGAASDQVLVEVREFQLPRLTVEAAGTESWWPRGSRPVVEGEVRYASGAPVRNSPVAVAPAGRVGEWPPPPGWLPETTVMTDGEGRFRLQLDPVPADLVGVAKLSLGFTATEPAGAVARGSTTLTLSADALDVSAVTELSGGLVPDANNRMYLRVARPDGRVLPGAEVRVAREWDPDDPGITATADADGVARFQLDPGQPVTVSVPPVPVRPEPRDVGPRLSIGGGSDALTGDALDVPSRVAVDAWARDLEACADRTSPGSSESLVLVARVGADGGVRRAVASTGGGGTDALTRCVAGRASRLRAAPGVERLWRLDVSVRDPDQPWVDPDVEVVLGDEPGVGAAAREALRDARSCVAGEVVATTGPVQWIWESTPGSKALALSPVPDASMSARLSPGPAACVARALSGLSLAAPATQVATGTLAISTRIPSSRTPVQPGPTTFPGFAFRVSAAVDGAEVGSTVLRMQPGEVPRLRVRFSEVIVDPGATVEVTAIRGPGHQGSFPDKIQLMQADRQIGRFDFDPDKRRGTVTIPPEVHGFVSVTIDGVRALLYVRSPTDLAVAVAADKPVYRPGETATLTVTTRDGTGPVAAGVTLSGVDSTLAALATLPGGDDFARVTVRSASQDPAFGVLDARALQTGQIAGENAAQAAVLRVSEVPPAPPGAARADGVGHAVFDRDGEAADAFYGFYGDVRDAVRAWEKAAPEGEVMTPKKMVELWEATLRAHPARDPFGNPLHLSQVPRDLLPLTDPRVLVADAARVPEDVEDWAAYVAKEAP